MATETEKKEKFLLVDGMHASDVGNAQRLLAYSNGTIRFVETWKTWLVYDEKEGRWVRDDSRARITEKAKNVSSKLMAFLTKKYNTLREEERKSLFTHIMNSERALAVRNMVDLAKGLPGVLISHEEIDAQPHLLNVLNGTVNLFTGELQAHNPEDLLMLQAPVFHNPAARSALWEKSLATWQANAETRAYLQRVCGTGISGDALEYFYINLGKGANGKTVAFEAMGRVLGPFRVEPHKSLLTVNKYESHATVWTTLKGARMAVASETSDNERLNETSIKKLTGGDTITARGMGENEWSFRPTHSLFLHTNYQPNIRETGEAIWRRVRVIPWGQTIPKEQRDEHLLEKLTTEEGKSAILNWLIEGYRTYRKVGDSMPPQVEEATSKYRQDEDVLGVFIEQFIREERGTRTPNNSVTLALDTFCHDRGEAAPSFMEVNKRLTGMGFKVKRMSVGNHWLNMILNQESDHEQGEHVCHVDLPRDSLEEPLRESIGNTTQPPFGGLQEMLAKLDMDAYWAARNGEVVHEGIG